MGVDNFLSGRPQPRRSPARSLSTLVLSVGTLVLVAGCAQTADPGASPSPADPTVTSTPSSSASDAGQLDLTIVADLGSGRQTWRLTCAPPGGTHPDPETACRVLAENGKRALPAVPKDRMCTQVYGGPEKATVSGTWNGETIMSTLSRVNGCEIGRWKALEGFLPRAGQ
jgi:hypothetical protein